MDGKFKAAFQKVNTLHAKNSFAFALVVGNLFASTQSSSDAIDPDVQLLVDGKIELALPTYFALGSHALPPAVVE